MIITITLNPALDKTVEIDNFCLGNVNRISSIRLDAGGKGINVSKVIKSLKGESNSMGILGGSTGRYIKEYLDNSKIENDFVFIKGETRTNVKIVDKINHTNTEVNESGPEVTGDELQGLEHKLFNKLSGQDIIIFSGSIPSNVDKEIYSKWVLKAKEAGAKTILDADGDMLKFGVKAGPYLVKPNIHELERMFDREMESVEETASFARRILHYGVEIVVVSLGEKGALFINKEKTIRAHGPKVKVISTVGAGDSMVAALAYCIDKSYSFENTVRLSIATGSANVMTTGTEPGKLETILKLEKEVSLEYLQF